MISVRDVLWLYRARLRAKSLLVQEGFAVLGIAVGVALLFASQVASTSLTHSVQQLTREIVGNGQVFQLQARAPDGFDERLLGDVRRMAGVQSALPVLEQQANVIGPRGERSVDLLGADPRFAHFGGPLLRRFSARALARQHAIGLPTPIAHAIGVASLETVKLQIGASVKQPLVGATLGEEDIGGLVNSPVALAPISYAQSLTGMGGRITRIFVRPQPGREREVMTGLQRLAGQANLNVEPGDYDSTLFAVAVAPQNKSELLFSAISALVGFMFALNAMLVTVPARRDLIKEVRSQGATRPMTVQIMLVDAAILGVLACVLGLALGELLSVAVFHATPGYLAFAFPVGADRLVTVKSVALAVGAGLIAAVAGVLWPLRDILVSPLWGEKVAKKRARVWVVAQPAIGLMCLVITTIVVVFYPGAAIFGNVALVVALVCLLPLLFDALVVAFDWFQESVLDGRATVLAVTELQSPVNRVRSLAVAMTAAIAVFGIVEFWGVQANLQRGLDASARGIDSSAELWATPSGESNAFATTSFRNLSSPALTRQPGVSGVGLYRGGFLNWGDRRIWVLAPPNTGQPIFIGQLVSGSPTVAAARIREGGWAVISRALASEHHLHIGQTFILPSPRPTRFKVAALSNNLGWPPGAVILSSGDYARAWASNDPSAYEIAMKPGISDATARRLVQSALGPGTGLTVETALEREHRHETLAAQGLSRLTQIRLLVLIAAVLAVAGAMGSMLWQRRELVASMRADGFRKGVLWRWLCCESAVLLVAGCLIGAVFGLYAQLLGSHFLASVTGFPIVFNIEVLAALASFTLVSGVAVAIIAVPGYFVVRVPPRTVSPAY